MSDVPPRYWELIAVLFSTKPLSPKLAMMLHALAMDLHQRGAELAAIDGDAAQGQVRNLNKDLLLGTLGGPAFEAQVETEQGSMTIRFLLTRQGIERMAARTPAAKQYVN